MKAIKDMTRDELIGLIYNNFEGGTVNIFEESACCVTCGTKEEAEKARWFYMCDACSKAEEEMPDQQRENTDDSSGIRR